MKYEKHYLLSRIVLLAFALAVSWMYSVTAAAQVYTNQYAVVVGINQYAHPHWDDLSYARNDAEGITQLMQELGFTVYTLYDAQATRTKIVSLLEDGLATRLQKNDAVFFFFAGHGTTRHKGGKVWGYVAPSDATDKDASLISMEELLTLSEKMGTAKHQLFIMDCCFGGLLGKPRAGGISEQHPYYLREMGTRIARQLLTAGGEHQQVVDGGPGGHSVFTGYLIKGIRERQADGNGDGWITFKELSNYVGTAASRRGQTPGDRDLPGHEMGEFLFRAPHRTPPTPTPFLRSTATTLSTVQVHRMLVDKGFFDTNLNNSGKGIKHLYRSVTRQGQVIVIDDATGLMWQQSGSPKMMLFDDTEKYIRNLNNQRFAGYNDWRLPTLEEAMSLMEPERKKSSLYIDPVFDRTKDQMWTADEVSAGVVWFVRFYTGNCFRYGLNFNTFVRAVRSGQ